MRLRVCLQAVPVTCGIVTVIAILTSCSPTNTKVSASPESVIVSTNSTLLITPMAELSENESVTLMDWATHEITLECSGLTTPNYWDVAYKSQLAGIQLPRYDSFDTTTFNTLQAKLDVNFVLLTRLEKLNENNNNELSNPDYQRREAIVSMKLIDLERKFVVWHCTTRVSANPVKANGKTQHYSINILSGSYAVSKAFKESIRRLRKSIVIKK